MATKVSKFFIVLFLIYELWYKEAYGNISTILYGTVILATVFVALDFFAKRTLKMNSFIIMLFVFGITSFVTGMFVSKDFSWFISSMITYFAFVIVCFDISYVISTENKREWLMDTFVIVSLICSFQTIFMGVDYKTEVIVRTMILDNNPNTLGFTMILGIFALIYKKERTSKHLLLYIAMLLLFLFVIVLTGSRKSLLCAMILLIIWTISILRTERGFSYKKIVLISGIFIAVLAAVYYVMNYYIYSSSYERLLMVTKSGGATSTRMKMFLDGISFWESSPIIGIGFGQYQILSPFHKYSHNSYAEILSCTGAIGFLIFFVPIFNLLRKIWKKARNKKEPHRYDYVMCTAMLLVELILGIGQIYIYDIGHLVILSYIAMSLTIIEFENNKTQL